MEFFKNMLWNIRGFFVRRGRMHNPWSLQKKIIAGVMSGVLVIGGSTGAVLAHHFSAEQPEGGLMVAMLNPPTMANVEVYEPTYVEIPNFVGMNLASDSLEKDLTLYFKSAESKARIEGVAFQVKLISPKNESYLTEYLDEIDRINKEIAAAKEDGTENDRYEGDDLEAPTASAKEGDTKVAGASHQKLQLTAAQVKTEDQIEEQKAEAENTISANFDELTIGEKLLLDKQIAIQSYATALTAVDGKNYVDDDSDGMIYINKIDSGKYVACMVPTGFYDPSQYATEVTVKDKVEYKKVENIKEKVKDASKVKDEKPADAAPQEAKFQDTVEWVESSKTLISGGYTETKPATLAPTVAGENPQTAPFKKIASRTTNRFWASIQQTMALSSVHAEELPANDPPANDPPTTDPNTDPNTNPGTTTPDPGTTTTDMVAKLSVPASATLYSAGGINTVGGTISVENCSNVTAASENPNVVTVAVNGNSVTYTAATGVADTATVKVNFDATCDDGQTHVSSSTLVTVIGAKTPIKSADGKDIFVDKDGTTAATVANYNPNGTFYVSSGEPKYKLTGWQTIDGKAYYYTKDGVPVTGSQVIRSIPRNFDASGALIPTDGIDVSKWQGNIDWATASGYVDFAIIRCAYRGSGDGSLAIDPWFAQNASGAKAHGVKIGIYIYSRATSEAQAVEEASLAIQCAQQAGGISYPIYIDMESAELASLSTEERTAIANAFCQTVRNAGYSAGVYANYNWMTKKLNMGAIPNASVWIARYNTSHGYSGHVDLWQYSSSGSIPGIKGNVDMNRKY